MINWHKAFNNVGLNVVYRIEKPKLWTTTYKSLPSHPVSYLASSLDYQLAYKRSHGGTWNDISCVIFLDNQAVALWPLSVAECHGIGILSSQGLPIMPPIFIDTCPVRARKKIIAKCFKIARALAIQMDIEEWSSLSKSIDRAGLNEWHLIAMREGARCLVRHELFVDLRLTLPEIKSSFRKSYRSLVTSGERLWQVEVLKAPGNLTIWNEFRALHANVSGRVTRSLQSWQLQHEALVNDEGFLISLRDDENRMVGAGFFNCSSDEGVYSVGAYDRSLFNKPLGHVVQYRAIEELRKRGCSWYRIGTRFFSGDEPKPSKKELSISNFKSGFASHVFPSFQLVHFGDSKNV